MILYKIETPFIIVHSHLSHLAPVEQVLHHQQVQLLLRVVLRVLVTDPVNSQNLRQRRRPLRHKDGFVIH